MGRSRDYHHHHHHHHHHHQISKNPEMVRFCLQPMVIQSHYKPTTQNISPLQNSDTRSKHGDQAPYCYRILPAGKWVSRAVQQNPVEVYSHVLGREKKLDGDETHYSPKNDPKPLPAHLLPLPTDPPLRRSTRHRKPPDFFQHT